MLLYQFPAPEDFYKNYWNKKPFIVRGAIDQGVFDDLIDGDTLAGLSLEDDIKSRLVITSEEGHKWTCHHGPFDDDKFSTLGDENWNLLVQNVEQYHPDTAQLLRYFNFSPRWLMDDIMVSYSAKGGSVGPHTDSYHVFLVQGIGSRRWKISHAPIENGEYIKNSDLKVLKNSFDGEEVDVVMGDVIYIPPHFAHEGITLEEAMTFSIGFLGPKISEMLVEYGHYLSDNSAQDQRYSGQELNIDSSSFVINQAAQKKVQGNLIEVIHSDSFSRWMAQYFSTPTHADIEDIESRENSISSSNLLNMLESGKMLERQEHIKIAVTETSSGERNIAVYGIITPVSQSCEGIIDLLNSGHEISIQDIEALGNMNEIIEMIACLYNQNVWSFTD